MLKDIMLQNFKRFSHKAHLLTSGSNNGYRSLLKESCVQPGYSSHWSITKLHKIEVHYSNSYTRPFTSLEADAVVNQELVRFPRRAGSRYWVWRVWCLQLHTMKVHSPKEMHAANMNSQPAMANHSIVIAHERSKTILQWFTCGIFCLYSI
jgi:hypothetical protein